MFVEHKSVDNVLLIRSMALSQDGRVVISESEGGGDKG